MYLNRIHTATFLPFIAYNTDNQLITDTVATVRFRNKSGLYPVYIRFTQVKQVSYVKTSWMVNDNGINERKEIIDSFVIKPKSVIRK